MRGPSLSRHLAAAAVAVASAVAASAAARAEPAPATSAGRSADTCLVAPQRQGGMRAAHYFGSASPANFWNSSFETLERDLARIRADGFDTVVLVVPWREFQPGLAPARYNAVAFRRLDRVFRAACRAGLGVALRVSYVWDFHAAGWLAPRERARALYADDAVYRDWLSYVERVGAVARRHANFRLAFLTWEDFWLPVDHAGALGNDRTPERRVEYAGALGFRDWVSDRYSLEQVSELYGEQIESWADLPTPRRDSPGFRLFFEFHDHALVERFFAPARARFPGLSLEVRVDLDAILDGGRLVGLHDHAATFALPETDVAVVYWSPAMGASNAGDQASARESLVRLAWMLERLDGAAGGRRLFVDQFNFTENHPLFAHNTAIADDELHEFLVGAAPLLGRYTDGYGIWTYRDYRADTVFNPSFSLGAAGWWLGRRARIVPRGDGRALLLRANGVARQAIPRSRDAGAGLTPTVRLTFRAWARGPRTHLGVRIGSLPERVVRLARGRGTYALSAPIAPLRSYSLRLQARGGRALLDDVRVFSFVQEGRIRSYEGTPGPALPAVRELNRRLAASRP